MKEFMMIFRSEKMEQMPPEEQMQAVMQQWQTWIAGLAKQGSYSGTNRLLPEGKTIQGDKVISDGPYLEGKEMIGGYLIVKANSLDDAMTMAQGCPSLTMGGKVEVRAVMAIEYDYMSANFLGEIKS